MLRHTANQLARDDLKTFAKLPADKLPTDLESYPPIYLMAEASWLAYEDARVAHHILTSDRYNWKVDKAMILELVSVDYKYATGSAMSYIKQFFAFIAGVSTEYE